MEIVTHVLTSPQAGLLPDNNDSQEIKTAKETRRRVARENIGINVGEGDIAAKSDMSVVPGTGADADKTTITLKPDTQATVLTEHQDVSGKAEKSEMTITAVSGDSTKKNIQLKSGTSQDVLVAHQDISGKADAATSLAGYGITDAYTKTETDTLLDGKVDEVTGKGLSTNDYSNDEKTKLGVIEAGAQVNVIETVKLAGTALTPDANKAVDIVLDYASDSDIEDMFIENVVKIGGRNYRTVNIGNQVWLAENLDFKFSGCAIGQGGSSSSDPMANYYDNDEDTYGVNGNKYGLLYNWIAVNYLEQNKATLIPGWHIPTTAEWDALATVVGGSSVAGTKLKSTTGWSSGAGTDEYGFKAFPGGSYIGYFSGVGSIAFFWTASENINYNAYFRIFETDATMRSGSNSKDYQYSVRLVKDAT